MKLKVLVIEDDEIEIMKLQRAVSKLGASHELVIARNGEEALEKLNDKNHLPNLIFVDLNMPRMNGIEFLQILRKDEVLKYIPAVILTTSNNSRDLLECYKAGIAGYLVKPLKYEDYTNKILKTLEYWSVNELVKA